MEFEACGLKKSDSNLTFIYKSSSNDDDEDDDDDELYFDALSQIRWKYYSGGPILNWNSLRND